MTNLEPVNVAPAAEEAKNIDEQTVAGRLVLARKALALTQAEVAEGVTARLLGSRTLSRAAYTQWELGLTTPDIEKVAAVADVLKISPAYLAFGTGGHERNSVGSDDNASVEVTTLGLEGPDDAAWWLPVAECQRLGVQDGKVRVIHLARNDPVEGLIKGAPAFVDTSVTRADTAGVYVIRSNGILDVAAISPRPGREREKKLSVRTGSAVHEVSSDEVDIVGRVVGTTISL